MNHPPAHPHTGFAPVPHARTGLFHGLESWLRMAVSAARGFAGGQGVDDGAVLGRPGGPLRWVPWAASRSRLQAVSSPHLVDRVEHRRNSALARRLRVSPGGRPNPTVRKAAGGWCRSGGRARPSRAIRSSAPPLARTAASRARIGSSWVLTSITSAPGLWSGARGRSARRARCGAARGPKLALGPAAAPPVPPPRRTSSAARHRPAGRRPAVSARSRSGGQAAGAVGFPPVSIIRRRGVEGRSRRRRAWGPEVSSERSTSLRDRRTCGARSTPKKTPKVILQRALRDGVRDPSAQGRGEDGHRHDDRRAQQVEEAQAEGRPAGLAQARENEADRARDGDDQPDRRRGFRTARRAS